MLQKVGTVSYTPLDVYKRQEQRHIGRKASRARFRILNQRYGYAQAPVSYTHLALPRIPEKWT